MNESSYSIAFIIPALNEQEDIGNTLNSIGRTMEGYQYEVLVSDNGSTDHTCEIAEGLGAKVIQTPNATIASLRNIGVENSHSPILAFIDADVTLAPDWRQSLEKDLPSWPTDRLIVSGSRCAVPATDGFIAKHWFSRLNRTETRYINSGHMVTTRALHNRISGFDATLTTSEDVDYCERAAKQGAKISPSNRLIAYHSGYPHGVVGFIRREAWHGREDMNTPKSILKSKVALTAIFNLIIILSPIPFAALLKTAWALAIPMSLLVAFCITLSYLKFGKLGIRNQIMTAICFELYLIGRGLSLVTKSEHH